MIKNHEAKDNVGIFVNDRGIKYGRLIVTGKKTIETRNRNMLHYLVGKRVAIIETGFGKPMIIGYATISGSFFCPASHFYDADMRERHFVPEIGNYSCNGKGKWCYELIDPKELEHPKQIPDDVIRHGMSWCEW